MTNLPNGCSQHDVDRAADPVVSCDFCGYRAPQSRMVPDELADAFGYDFLCPRCLQGLDSDEKL